MNLLKDKWLPVIRRNSKPGEFENIAIWQLIDGYCNNPVTEIIAPRPDFRNAIYQLLIGVVQVSALPEDNEHWRDLYYSPWNAEEFKTKILSLESCFEIDSMDQRLCRILIIRMVSKRKLLETCLSIFLQMSTLFLQTAKQLKGNLNR